MMPIPEGQTIPHGPRVLGRPIPTRGDFVLEFVVDSINDGGTPTLIDQHAPGFEWYWDEQEKCYRLQDKDDPPEWEGRWYFYPDGTWIRTYTRTDGTVYTRCGTWS